MIIPVRCFTCGKAIAHKWLEYKEALQEEYEKDPHQQMPMDLVKNKKGLAGHILDQMGFDRDCCRRMFIGQVDMIQDI